MKNISDFLHQKDLKATKARMAVLGLFLSDTKPLNAEYISRKTGLSGIDQVTVYRTLSSLERSKIIRIVDLRKGSTFYELAEDHHHHIVCTGCGVIEHIEGCEVEKISEKLLAGSKKFRTVIEHSFELFGLCINCVKN